MARLTESVGILGAGAGFGSWTGMEIGFLLQQNLHFINPGEYLSLLGRWDALPDPLAGGLLLGAAIGGLIATIPMGRNLQRLDDKETQAHHNMMRQDRQDLERLYGTKHADAVMRSMYLPNEEPPMHPQRPRRRPSGPRA